MGGVMDRYQHELRSDIAINRNAISSARLDIKDARNEIASCEEAVEQGLYQIQGCISNHAQDLRSELSTYDESFNERMDDDKVCSIRLIIEGFDEARQRLGQEFAAHGADHIDLMGRVEENTQAVNASLEGLRQRIEACISKFLHDFAALSAEAQSFQANQSVPRVAYITPWQSSSQPRLSLPPQGLETSN
jgi:chromosome segregation ATPase